MRGIMKNSNENHEESRWILGTATFQDGYGVANQNNKSSKINSAAILDQSIRLGIDKIDTASTYGPAEALVGEFHMRGRQFSCYTKISQLEATEAIDSVSKSAKLLRIQKFKGVYFHNHDNLLKATKSDVQRIITELVNKEMSEVVGVSVYTEEDIQKVTDAYPEIKLFQVPENLMDRRLINSSVIRDMKNAGYIFNVRSIFLQGLLLMDPAKLPENLIAIKQSLSLLAEYASKQNTTIHNLCINYVNSIPWATGVIVGAASARQLRQTLNFTNHEWENSNLPESLPEPFCDPRKWQSISN
jgi:aryl-alcohol dehydrogenase-like predicted oxidoreductase